MFPCAFGLSSGYVRVLLFHDVIFSRSPHSHIVVFSCSVPCFSQLCPIIVRSILGLSVESLVTYWGVGHICVRTECFVRKWFSLEPRCKDTTSPQTNHTFLYVSCDSRTFLLWNVCMPMNNLVSQGGNLFIRLWHQGDGNPQITHSLQNPNERLGVIGVWKS